MLALGLEQVISQVVSSTALALSMSVVYEL